MKRKLFICSVIAIFISITALGTTAYFSHEATARNVITAGNVKIQLLQHTDAEQNTVPYDGAVAVMPCTEISKIVEVKNTGTQAAWIRVSVQKAIAFAEGISGEPDLSLIHLDWNLDAWHQQEGYFYYLKALNAGETTEPLFTTVAFSTEMNNQYQNSTATIDITAQAVQFIHNGSTVFEADGWPNHD